MAYYSKIKHFDTIRFTNGYGAKAPMIEVECKGIRIGTGRYEWGAIKSDNFFIIELGEIITVPA